MVDVTSKYRIYPLNAYLDGSKRCLGIQGNSSNAWANIIVADYNPNDPSQIFTFEKVGNEFKIVTCYNRQVFDVKEYRMQNGSPIIQYGYNGGGNQHWNITKFGKEYLSQFMMMLGIHNNALPDSIYNITIKDFQLVSENGKVFIDNKDSQELYILEKMK